MAILGKAFGAYFGFALTRSVQGTVLGLALGQLTDSYYQMFVQGRTRRFLRRPAPVGARGQFGGPLDEALAMMGKVIAADGPPNTAEYAALTSFIRSGLRLKKRKERQAFRISEWAMQTPTSFHEHAVRFYAGISQDRQSVENCFLALVHIGSSDGPLSPRELSLILSAGEIFQLEPEFIAENVAPFTDSGPGPSQSRQTTPQAVAETDPVVIALAALELAPGASPDDVKRAYRKLVAEYHPDKIAAKDLPAGFVTFANDRFRNIQAAYELLKRDQSE